MSNNLLSYFTKLNENSSSSSNAPNPPPIHPPTSSLVVLEDILDDYPADPGLRKNINLYNANEREKVRRFYLQKGPFQPKNHIFPWHLIGQSEKRRFIPSWFNDHPIWLEYSIAKDAAFCLYCYLFKPEHGEQSGGDSFVGDGFRNWKKKERFNVHVGSHSSIHNNCVRAGDDLMKQKQHIEVSLCDHSSKIKIDYRTRLTASIDCIRFLLHQGLPLRGRDESEDSSNKGKFLELLQFLADHNEDVNKVSLTNAPENLKLIAPSIQHDIINSIASLTTNSIVGELGDELFSILVDEARDISVKEQMAVVLCYVDDKGFVVERFLGIVHVRDTSALSLKSAIDSLFCLHGLSISSLRGQGYDGASNMRGEFNGLKSLILEENKSAFYVHCFAHQLQLTLVAVAENHRLISTFFDVVSQLSNIVGASCKRRDILRDKQFEKVVVGVCNGEILTGQGMNQEMTLKRVGATRWGSHYGTLMSILNLFPSVVEVVMVVEEDAKNQKHRGQADNLLRIIQCFEFVFQLHLMKNVLGITNDLSQALQKKDQDMVNAMKLVRITKLQLQNMRDNGWERLFEEVSIFCIKNEIVIPDMDSLFVVQGRSRRKVEGKTYLHYYRVELFYEVIDMQLQELNNRFNEVNTELLLCMACLSPSDTFSEYDKRKLIRFAEFYPLDFSPNDLMQLDHQLDNYIMDVRTDNQFSKLEGISSLAKKMVQRKKHRLYPLVYLLLKLTLLLPVATATVERVFSAMKIIKTSLRNRLGDDVMNDCLVPYIERDIARIIETNEIVEHFQNMKSRRVCL